MRNCDALSFFKALSLRNCDVSSARAALRAGGVSPSLRVMQESARRMTEVVVSHLQGEPMKPSTWNSTQVSSMRTAGCASGQRSVVTAPNTHKPAPTAAPTSTICLQRALSRVEANKTTLSTEMARVFEQIFRVAKRTP